MTPEELKRRTKAFGLSVIKLLRNLGICHAERSEASGHQTRDSSLRSE